MPNDFPIGSATPILPGYKLMVGTVGDDLLNGGATRDQVSPDSATIPYMVPAVTT